MASAEPFHGCLANLVGVQLGSGRSSTVQLGRSAAGDLVAVKIFSRSWCVQNRDYVLREVLHHATVSAYKHPFVVELRGITLVGQPASLALVLEYVEGTQPLDKFQEQHGGVLPTHVARRLFQQLVLAVDFCHRLGKANRDLKLNDMLVDISSGDVKLKLCDFSFAKDKVKDSQPKTQLGTALFAAPEIVTSCPGTTYDGAAADVWSLGVVLSTLLFGQHPFLSPTSTGQKASDQIYQIINNSILRRLQIPAECAARHPEAYELLQQLLSLEPKERPTASDIMLHPFLRTNIPQEWLTLNDELLAHPGSQPWSDDMIKYVSALVDRVVEDAANDLTHEEDAKLTRVYRDFTKRSKSSSKSTEGSKGSQ